MKTLRLLLFTPLLMAFQCDDEIIAEEDLLFETGIYAGWELDSQTVNGVTDLRPPPEIRLEFYPDENPQDKKGGFDLEEPSTYTAGIFIMDQAEQTITFKREGKEDLIYGYIIDPAKDLITFTFTESNAQFEQGWRKRY